MADRKDVISLLKEDHKKVKAMLEDLEDTTERAVGKRKSLLTKIASEVRAHARVEEEIFYPAFHDSAQTKEDTKLFHEATQEHHVVTQVLDELEQMDPSTEKFAAQAKVLKDMILHHVKEEERELMPAARKVLDKDELLDLGERLQARKQELVSRTAPKAL